MESEQRDDGLQQEIDRLRQALAEAEERAEGWQTEAGDLQAELHLLRYVVDELPDIVFAKDRRGRFVLANPAMAAVKGCDETGQMIGRTDSDFSPEDLVRGYLEDDCSVMESGQPLIGREEWLLDAGGERQWLVMTKIPWRDRDGQVIGVIGIGRDITYRKKAELDLEEHQKELEQRIKARTHELLQTNARLEEEVAERTRVENALAAERNLLRILIDNLPHPVYVKDKSGRFLVTNAASARSVGADSPENMLGKTDFDVSPTAVAQAYTEADARILSRGEALINHQEPAVGPDGRARWYSTTKVPVFDADGRVTGLVGISRDISRQLEMEAALRQSEEQLRTLVNNIPGAVYRCALDEHWTMSYVSDTVEEITGYPASDFVNNQVRTFTSIIHPDDRQMVTGKIVHSVIEQEQPYELEYRVLHANGELRWVYEKGQGVLDAAGQVEWLAGAIFDVSESKRAQEALAAERNLLRTIIDNLPDWVFVKDRGGRYVTVNQAMAEALGADSVEDAVGKTDFDYSPSSLAHRYANSDQQVMLAGQALIGREEPIQLPSGERRWASVTKVPLRNNEGTIIGLVALARDLTARKQMEEALRDREVQYRTLFEQANDAILLVSPQDRIVDANRRACDLYGYDRQELLALKLSVIQAPDSLEASDGVVDRWLREYDGLPFETMIQRQDGTLVPVEISLSALSGRQAGQVLVTVRDITERRRAGEQLRARSEALSAANLELAQALQSKDEFLATMSHELRTPLNAILGFTEGLQDQVYGGLNEQQLRALHGIEHSGNHLLALINDVLDMAKIDAGKMELDIQDVSVDAVCRASLSLIHEAAEKREIRVTYREAEDVETIKADARRLQQILVNLLSNAVKFTPSGGDIGLEVSADPEEEVVRFAVWDTGIGIAAQDLDRLFKPFEQLDSSLSRQYSGTGLGLSLVYRMTDLHGGSVTVESTLGEGSRFVVALPRAVTDRRTGQPSPAWDVTGAPPAGGQTVAPEVTGEAGGKLILLVEDNQNNLDRLAGHLLSSGYRLAVATSGVDAVARAREIIPDLILMDVQMPEMDGLKTIRHLQNDPNLSQVPIIALTALSRPGDRDRCLAAGARLYLSRPVSPKTLAENIKDVLGE